MGQEGSVQAPQYTVKDGFDQDQFQKQHNANQPELVLQQLSSLGTDLSKISPKVPIPMAVPHPKILFIICNTYTTEQYKLGSGPLNDSLAFASFLKQLGYTVFYLHNSTSKIFIEWFRHILKNATTDLTLFFAGYACHPKENDESEKNEVMLFDDGYIKDEELSDLLSQCRGPNQRTVLLSDCCHSGTIWDLQSFKKKAPQNVLSISSAKDSQGTLDSKDQGIFTLYFWKIWTENPTITVKEMKEKISTPLSKYQLHLDYYSTTPELEDQPIFAKPEEAPAKPAPKLSLKPASAKTEGQNKPTPSKPETPAAEPKAETPAKTTNTETPAVTERAAPTPEVKEEKPAEPEVKEEKPAEPAVKEEKPAEPAVATKEQAKEEKLAEDKKEKSSSDDDNKSSSSDDEDKKEKSSSDDEDKKKKSSSDDEDDKSSSDNEEKKGKSSSDDEDDKSSGDEDDKSD